MTDHFSLRLGHRANHKKKKKKDRQIAMGKASLPQATARGSASYNHTSTPGTSTPCVAVWGGSMTRYATAASTKYRHRSDRSAPLSTAITGDDNTVLSTLPPTPQRLGRTGRQVAPNEYRPLAIGLSCVKRRTSHTKNSTSLSFLSRKEHNNRTSDSANIIFFLLCRTYCYP